MSWTLIGLGGSTNAQLNKWLVREVAGVHLMDMSAGDPAIGPLIPGFGTNGQEDVNLMTDAVGNVLFACAVASDDQISVHDAAFAPMPNGTGLWGNSSTMESCISPVPCHSDRWYIIHRTYQPGGGELFYSEVDLSLNGGNGDVTSTKNVLVLDQATEGFAVTRPNSHGCRWLFAARVLDNTSYEVVRCLISDNGIGTPQPVTTVTIADGALTYCEIEFNSASDRMAMSTPSLLGSDPDIVQWHFDPESGELGDMQELSVSDGTILGIEYSPQDLWLYFQENSAGASDLGRVEVATSTVQMIDTDMGGYRRSLEEGGNGRIYSGGDYYTDHLTEIDFPDAPLLPDIGYEYEGVFVSSGGMRPGLPNAIDGEIPGTSPTPAYIDFSASSFGNCDTYVFTDSTCLGTWWEWDFGDGMLSNDPTPIHQFGPGSFDITLRILACGDTLTLTKPAYITSSTQLPTAMGLADQDTLCAGEMVQFTDLSLNTTGIQWFFGDGESSTSIAPEHVYDEPGMYLVVLVATNGCGNDSLWIPVQVGGGEAVMDVALVPCGTAVVVSALGNGPVIWHFGDGTSSNAAQDTHDYGAIGDWNLILVASPGTLCADTAEMTITIGPLPVAAFQDSVGCTMTAYFHNTSSNSGQFIWYFGDGTSSPATDAMHSYSTPDTVEVILIAVATDGCTDTLTRPVVIHPAIEAAFSAHPDTCSGTWTFIGTVQPAAAGSQWSFGDGTQGMGTSVQHHFPDAIPYTVTLTATDAIGCEDQATMVVAPLPIVTNGSFFIPNVFSPNNDGYNDVFRVGEPDDCVDASFVVYNRWGQKVFEGIDDVAWDGRVNGEIGKESVYMVIVSVSGQPLTGTVTLLR